MPCKLGKIDYSLKVADLCTLLCIGATVTCHATEAKDAMASTTEGMYCWAVCCDSRVAEPGQQLRQQLVLLHATESDAADTKPTGLHESSDWLPQQKSGSWQGPFGPEGQKDRHIQLLPKKSRFWLHIWQGKSDHAQY